MSPHRRTPRTHHHQHQQQAWVHVDARTQPMQGASSNWVQVLMAWAHAMLVVPLVHFWEHSVLGPSEELVTSAVHLVCQEAARAVNGVSSWFLALFNNQHRSSLQERWHYNPWHTWWTQQEQRPNTLNAYLASIDTTGRQKQTRSWQQQYRAPAGQAEQRQPPQEQQQQQQPPVQSPTHQQQEVQQQPPQAKPLQQEPAELQQPSQEGASLPRPSLDWTARLGALVAGVRKATPPSPTTSTSLKLTDSEALELAGKNVAQAPAGPASFGKQSSSSSHQQVPDGNTAVASPLSTRSLEGPSQASRLLRSRHANSSASGTANAPTAAEPMARNKRARTRVAANGSGKGAVSKRQTQRPVVFLQQSGMAVIDAAMARASRTTGLVEDMRLALGLRIAALFDAARQALRWLAGLEPHAPPVSPNPMLHPQQRLSLKEGHADDEVEPADGLGRTSRGQALPGMPATQSMIDMSSLRLTSVTGPEPASDALVRHAVLRTMTERQHQQSLANNRRSDSGQPLNMHMGPAGGPISPGNIESYHRLAGGHGTPPPRRVGLAPSGRSLRRTNSFSTWEEAVAHRREVTAGDVISQAGYPLELHTATTQDGYILCMERIPRPGSKDVVFFMHGVLDTSMSWVSAGSTGSQAFAAWEMGYDVWLGNSRCNAPRLHQDPKLPATNPAYWRFSVNELGELDVAAQLQLIHDTKCLELGVVQQLQQQQALRNHMMAPPSPTFSHKSNVYGQHSPPEQTWESREAGANQGRSNVVAGRLTRAAASEGHLPDLAERKPSATGIKLQSHIEVHHADSVGKPAQQQTDDTQSAAPSSTGVAADGQAHEEPANQSCSSMHSSSSLPAELPSRASMEQQDEEQVDDSNRRYNNSGATSRQSAATTGHPALRVSTSSHARQTAVGAAGMIAAAAQAAALPSTPTNVFRRANSSSALSSLLAGAAPSRSRSANLNDLARHAEQNGCTSAAVQAVSSRQSVSSLSQAGAAIASSVADTMSRQTSGGVTAGSALTAAAAGPDPYRLRAVGHSLGGMSLLIYLVRALQAGKPTHIHRLILLTPAGFHNKLPNVAKPVCFVLPKGLWLFRCLTWPWWRRLPLWRPALPLYVPTTAVRSLLFKLLSDVRQMPPLQELFSLAIRLLLSNDASQWDRAIQMPHYGAKAMPAVSMDSVLHLAQCANAKKFRMFDYGSGQLNRLMYGVTAPPDVAEAYGILGDLPVDLVAGAKDGIIPPHNVRCHYEYMKKAGVKVSYKEFDFGHLDFTFAVKDELKTYLLRQLRK